MLSRTSRAQAVGDGLRSWVAYAEKEWRASQSQNFTGPAKAYKVSWDIIGQRGGRWWHEISEIIGRENATSKFRKRKWWHEILEIIGEKYATEEKCNGNGGTKY